ncbi:unnamed protein product [Amaranthus hypochondriacus]
MGQLSRKSEVQDISTNNTLQGVLPAKAFGVVSSEAGKTTMETTSTVSLTHGAVSVIGRRRSMEDAVTVVPANGHDLDHEHDRHLNYDFYGVYDGNGVAYRVAQKCKERLHHVVAEQFAVLGAEQWENVMATSFARVDDEITRDECTNTQLDDLVGSTALVVLVGSQEIVVANFGDSKAVLSSDHAVLTLSRDTKLTRQAQNVSTLESTAVSGDTKNVKPNVISRPEVRVHKRSKTDNFLVIGSDGLWDVVGDETACDIVRKCCSGQVLSKRVSEGVIGNCAAASAAMLVELALARGSKDNISVIVVELQHVNNANASTQST